YVMKSNLRRLVPAIERSLRMAAEHRAKREAEEAARGAERRFKAESANIPGIVLRIEYESTTRSIRLPWLSEGPPALCGHSPERLQGEPDLLFQCLRADSAAALREAIEAAAQDRRTLRWEGRLRGDGIASRWWLL